MSNSFLRRANVVSVAQSCPTLGDPMDCSPPGSSVHGILQARILEWTAMPSSRGSSWPRGWTQVSHVAGRFALLQGILPTQGWNSGLPRCREIFLPPGDLPDPGVELRSPAVLADSPSSRGSSWHGLNPGLLHCWQILYQLSPQGAAQAPAEGSAAAPGHWLQCRRGLVHCCKVLFGCTVLDHRSSAHLITTSSLRTLPLPLVNWSPAQKPCWAHPGELKRNLSSVDVLHDAFIHSVPCYHCYPLLIVFYIHPFSPVYLNTSPV